MTADPNREIYSPEASDGQRFGDWQTYLAVGLFVLICGALAAWWAP